MTTGRINQIATHVSRANGRWGSFAPRSDRGFSAFAPSSQKACFTFTVWTSDRNRMRRLVLSCMPLTSRLISKLSLRSARADDMPWSWIDRFCLWDAQLLTERHSGTINTYYHRSCDRWILRLVFLVNSQSWSLHAQSELTGMPALLVKRKSAPRRVRSYAAGSDC